METTAVQRIPWYYRPVWAAGKAASGISNAALKTASLWANTPKALKLPLETAALLYAPAEPASRAAFGAATVLIETPRDLASILGNRPIKYFGERWQLFSASMPADPKAPLTDLDMKIGAFERIQPPAPLPPAQPKSKSEAAEAPLYDMEKVTDKNLDILIEKISYFSIFKALHLYSGVGATDTSPLLSLVDEASRTKKPSLWNLFTARYGSQMSWWGKLKAGFLYLFLWKWIPIIPKTVEAYSKNMLSELRTNLKDNGEKRKKFFNGLLEDADNFFDVYNGAAETYAKDNARTGNLNHYRKNAVDLMLPKDDPNQGKSPEELRMDLYRKLSASIVDHFSPKVQFGFLETWLNNRIKNVLREQVLPEVFLAITDEGEEATKRHNIPFFLALTKTLTVQIAKIQAKLEEEPSDSSSLYGIKNFESIVKKFLWAVDMAGCKTVDEVRTRTEQLKKPEGGLDADVRNGIQLGIQKGLAVLFDYISKRENTEELFANLFESIATPLSGNLPMNDKQWAEMAVEYEGAKILLKQAGSSLSKQIVQEAVQDKVRGGSVPEATERAAQKIFAQHRSRGEETFDEMAAYSEALVQKVHRSKDFSTDDTSIHPELGAIASVLKAFENKERVMIAMEQDPPPQIAMLPHAEQEAILRVLYPVYEGANDTMNLVLALQALQKRHSHVAKTAREFRQIKESLEGMAIGQPEPTGLLQITRAQTHFKRIEPLASNPSSELSALKEQIDSARRFTLQTAELQKALDALEAIQPFAGDDSLPPGLLDQLVLSVQGQYALGFKKWKCIEQIKEKIKAAGFSPDEQQKAYRLIDRISKYNSLPEPRPDFEAEIWEPLAHLFDGKKRAVEASQKRLAAQIERAVSRAHQIADAEEAKAHAANQIVWEEMLDKANRLRADAHKLSRTIHNAKKEVLLHPSASQLGQIGGTLGYLLGLAASHYSPEYGSLASGAFGAAAALSVSNLKHLAKGKWIRFAFPFAGGAAAAGFAAKTLGDAARGQWLSMPTVPALVGAAAASAGLEYVGRNMTRQIIDTGVEVAMPKVTQIFDTAYEHFLTNDIVINGGLKILMKQVVELFPPKK